MLSALRTTIRTISILAQSKPFSTVAVHECETIQDYKLLSQKYKEAHITFFYSAYGKPSIQLKKKVEFKAMEHKVPIITVDVELVPELCEEFHVESVPTMFTSQKSSIKETYVGVPNDEKIELLVKSAGL